MTANTNQSSSSSQAPPSVLAQIRAAAPSLPPSDARVAEQILRDADAVTYMSITQLAEAARVSEATVVRASKRLGWSGFQALKFAIARDHQPALNMVHENIEPDEDMSGVLSKVLSASSTAIQESIATIEPDEFASAVKLIADADRLLIVGFGPSSIVADDAAYRFRCIGVQVETATDAISRRLIAADLGGRGVLLAISHTGATKETLSAVEAAATGGAPTIAVTSFARSPLTLAADHALIAGGREISFRVDAMASRLAHLSVLDAVYVGVALKSPDRALDTLSRVNAAAASYQI